MIKLLRCADDDKVMFAGSLNLHVPVLIVAGVVMAREISTGGMGRPKPVVPSLKTGSRTRYDKQPQASVAGLDQLLLPISGIEKEVVGHVRADDVVSGPNMHNVWVNGVRTRTTVHLRFGIELVLTLNTAFVAIPLLNWSSQAEKALFDDHLSHAQRLPLPNVQIEGLADRKT